jgi:hypothetical protein
MDFPRCLYSPLRPQTTIAIDQVNTTNSDTQPSVKISIVPLFKWLQKVSNIYHTGIGQAEIFFINAIVTFACDVYDGLRLRKHTRFFLGKLVPQALIRDKCKKIAIALSDLIVWEY